MKVSSIFIGTLVAAIAPQSIKGVEEVNFLRQKDNVKEVLAMTPTLARGKSKASKCKGVASEKTLGDMGFDFLTLGEKEEDDGIEAMKIILSNEAGAIGIDYNTEIFKVEEDGEISAQVMFACLAGKALVTTNCGAAPAACVFGCLKVPNNLGICLPACLAGVTVACKVAVAALPAACAIPV